MKKYTKEEVVELLKEYQEYPYLVDRFLKEKGLIKEELEVGVWYVPVDYGVKAFNYQGGSSYGFDVRGFWQSELDADNLLNEYTKATDEEIESLLIEEAKKRGLVEGFEYMSMIFNRLHQVESYDIYNYNITRDTLYAGDNSIYNSGKWATPITSEEMTLKDVCKELGRNIKIVK